ncbi:hypothetical protein [Streptomyces radicis]|uniref:Cobyrinic acid a,c-diamide synthase n=1 Tax=Streptomyces radicis TaxID=1750517 RepID=A0A3A9VTZ2_9ACTN|nr:hypothetical protein [Streptomyces radicis]RKN04002.1 hypothetical protein D7319_29885 [Streptomyces radicis]RKN14213.1 hypothetical protein D7318_29645 [Streptomyces radicis]
MPRRVSLPAADELFRSTGGAAVQPSTPQESASGAGDGAAGSQGATPRVPAPAGEQTPPGDESEDRVAAPRAGTTPPQQKRETAGRATQPAGRSGAGSGAAGAKAQRRSGRQGRRPSGRERHDEKITVYVSAEELMDLEHARLVLRGEHGLAVDRGRIVREAVAVVLADLESRGEASILVRRLRGR